MSESKRQGSCSSVCRGFCTVILVLVWLLVAFGVLFCHLGLAKVVPALQDLPDNLKTGFMDVLGFEKLESEANNVKAAAEEALPKCEVNATAECPQILKERDQAPSMSEPPTPEEKERLERTSDTTAEIAKIKTAFNEVLDMILRVTTDPIFGTDAFNSTATHLQKILDDLNQIEANDTHCVASNIFYCDIRSHAEVLGESGALVNAEIDKFSDTDEMKSWEKYGEQLVYVHALPYVFVIAMAFFTLFWWKDAACCCCGGSCIGAVFLALFVPLYLVFFGFSLAIAIAGFLIRNKSDEIPINGVFRKDVSLKELLDHIQKEYPEFWNTVFGDLVDGLKNFNVACLIFVVICIAVLIYGLSICLCRPYTDRQKAKAES